MMLSHRNSTDRTIRDLLIVLAIASVCFFLNLGGPDLWDRDETRNAGCAAEMLKANDWIVPVFNAELRDHKPALTYWLMMLSYLVFGVTEFAARLPSALYGMGTVTLTYLIGKRLFGYPAAIWTAFALTTSIMFGVASRAATPDAPLIFFITLAISIYIFGTTNSVRDPESGSAFVRLFPEKWSTNALMYAAMGMALLAKGPIGMILPTAIIGMFLLIKRLPERATSEASKRSYWGRFLAIIRPFQPWHFLKTCWSMRPFTALACALAVALPWYVLVHLKTEGEWTHGFFVKHNVGRAMNSMDGHRGNFLFYPVSIIVGFFPFSIFWLPALLDGIRQIRENSKWKDEYLFAFCWVGVYLGLFSLAKTKLPSYITPCYPGVAMVIGMFVHRWSSGELFLKQVWPRVIYGSMMLVGLGILIALPIVAYIFIPQEKLLGLLGFIPLVGGGLALVASEKQQYRKSVLTTAVTAVMISTGLFAFAADRVGEHRQLDKFVELIYQQETPEEVDVISYAATEASWVFYARQPIEYFDNPQLATQALLRPMQDGKTCVLVTSKDRYDELAALLPPGSVTLNEMPYFMEETELVIARPSKQFLQTSERSSSSIQ